MTSPTDSVADDVLTATVSALAVIKIAGAERALAFQTLAFLHYMSPRVRYYASITNARGADRNQP